MHLVSSFSNTVWGRLMLLLALAMSTATAASARSKPARHRVRIHIPKMLPTILPEAREGFQTILRGRASWYGKFFQGMETASGERYDRSQWTCAHKKLPFGTRLRVTNLDNGVTVVVRVSDRGPFRKERIIDLSERAATPLGLVEAGSASVIAVVVPDETPLGLADTPADLAGLQAADPQPQAPFTAYQLPLPTYDNLQPALASLTNAPVGPLASLAALPAQPAVPGSGFEVEAGLFASSAQARAQLARIQELSPELESGVKAVLLHGQPTNRVVVSQLDSWLAAETVRRSLQAGGTASLVRAAQPDPEPEGANSTLATLN